MIYTSKYIRKTITTLQVAAVSVTLGRLASASKQAGKVDFSLHGGSVPHRHWPPSHILSLGGEKSRDIPQASARPHLQTPKIQVYEFPSQGALVPHLQTPLTQLPDGPQSIPRHGSKYMEANI